MYGKFFASTFTGSMFGAGAPVFAVWGYVIANTIASRVELNPRLVASVLGMTPSDVEAAVAFLSRPDPSSRNPDAQGRRLVQEGQFQYRVTSHEIYRAIHNEDERRAYNRDKQRESRAKRAVKPPVNDSQEMSTLSAHTEEDRDLDLQKQKIKIPRAPRSAGLARQEPPSDFLTFWSLYPKRLQKQSALKAWLAQKPDLALVKSALDWQINQPAWTKDAGQFIPHPATWLNRRQWEDEPFQLPHIGPPIRMQTPGAWREECRRLHGDACGNRHFHAAKMAESGVDSPQQAR